MHVKLADVKLVNQMVLDEAVVVIGSPQDQEAFDREVKEALLREYEQEVVAYRFLYRWG